jgi:hypothetical protein
MIQIEFGPSSILGVGLVVVGILLYIIRTKNPGLSRDYDLFFSSVGLLCGSILMFQGWRLDPILLLCQLLSSGTAIFFVAESLWLRNNNIKQVEPNNILNLDTKYSLLAQNQNRFILNDPFILCDKSLKLFDQNHMVSCAKQTPITYTYPIDYESKSEYLIKSFHL